MRSLLPRRKCHSFSTSAAPMGLSGSEANSDRVLCVRFHSSASADLNMKIAVFGLGYVGSVVSACLAQDGHDVTGIDLDVDKVNSINNSKSRIVEPQLQEAIAKAVGTGRLRARTSVQDIGDISFVSVVTPSNENGSFGVSQLLRVSEQIGVLLA